MDLVVADGPGLSCVPCVTDAGDVVTAAVVGGDIIAFATNGAVGFTNDGVLLTGLTEGL